jgi:hypothetical protein
LLLYEALVHTQYLQQNNPLYVGPSPLHPSQIGEQVPLHVWEIPSPNTSAPRDTSSM